MNQQNTSFPERTKIDVLMVGAGATVLTAGMEPPPGSMPFSY